MSRELNAWNRAKSEELLPIASSLTSPVAAAKSTRNCAPPNPPKRLGNLLSFVPKTKPPVEALKGSGCARGSIPKIRGSLSPSNPGPMELSTTAAKAFVRSVPGGKSSGSIVIKAAFATPNAPIVSRANKTPIVRV